MINQTAITECLRYLVGYEQNQDPEISGDLIQSESGLRIQGLHPLLTVENMVICSKLTGEKFTDYLSKKRDQSISKLINTLYTEKKLNENSRELLSEVRMYEGVGNFSDKIVKQGRFVGYRIENIGKDLSLVLRSVGLQLDTLNPDFKLYIYHSSKSDPVAVVEVKHNKAISFMWYTFDKKILPETVGGAYLIGYYEDDLSGQAIKRTQYLTRKPQCSSCERMSYQLWMRWSQYLSIRPFYVNSDGLNTDRGKWEESAELYIDGNNWGLNLSLSIVCDPSDLFCRNRDLFSDALSKQMVVDLLTDIAYSTRDSQGKQKISQMAFYALGNRENNQGGLQSELERAIKALNFDTSDLNTLCLPCQNTVGRITYKSVF